MTLTAEPGVIRFTVQCGKTVPGEHLVVVGAPGRLGAWSPDQSKVMLTTCPKTFPTWTSECIALPGGQRATEYKYVICGAGQARWEGRSNRCIDMAALRLGSIGTVTDTFDCEEDVALKIEEPKTATTLQTVQSSYPEVPPQFQEHCGEPGRTSKHQQPEAISDASLAMRFVVECRVTQPGEELMVVGSTASLGNWSPSKSSVVLRTSEQEFPSWSSDWIPWPDSELPAEFKFVICKERVATTWEVGANRQLISGSSSSSSRRRVIVGDFGKTAASRFSEECQNLWQFPRHTQWLPRWQPLSKPQGSLKGSASVSMLAQIPEDDQADALEHTDMLADLACLQPWAQWPAAAAGCNGGSGLPVSLPRGLPASR